MSFGAPTVASGALHRADSKIPFKGNDSFSRQKGHGYYNTIRLLVALGLYF